MLPDSLLDAINRLIRDGRYTIDQILDHLRTIAPDSAEIPSRSAIGRYKKKNEEVMACRRESVAISRVWAEDLSEDPQGDVGTLLFQLLQTVSFQELLKMSAANDGADPKKIALLAKAIRDMGETKKTKIETDTLIREEIDARAEAAQRGIDKVEAEAAADPQMDKAAMLKRIREEIYGVFE